MRHSLLVNIHIYLHLFSWQMLLTKLKLMAFPWQVDQNKNRNKVPIKTINRRVEQNLITHKQLRNNKSPQRTASVRENILLLLL